MKRLLPFFTLLVALAAACGDDDGSMADASLPDAAMDAPPECVDDVDCDDGLFCNGAESCASGRCLFEDAPSCDDGVACTLDLCDEELDACVAVAPDEDGDGAGDAACVDADGTPLGSDCDDTDAFRFPGNPEVCDLDGHDEDCDPDTFGARDVDHDGFLDAMCCNTRSDATPVCGDDCRDVRPGVNPMATEACDGVDNDCDGLIDEGVIRAGHHDADGDGFGDESRPRMACPGVGRFAPEGTPFDCDDDDVSRNPGQVEICDMVDNDCNGLVDDDTRPVEWFADLDRDGFGSRDSGVVSSCVPVAEHSLRDTDCNDDDPAIHPAAGELCDAIDNDCNGLADFEIAPGDFEDDDGDGLVDIACGPPRGTDCDDEDAGAGPGTPESCDGRDNDCDDLVDEGAMDLLWYFDGDGDGHGSSGSDRPIVRACSPPAGYVGSGADCDDVDAMRAPGLPETCDALDDDCDGAVDEEGICACPTGTLDCDGNGTCETDITSDEINCGMCFFACEGGLGANEVECVSGTCAVTRCFEGRGDCDGLVSNQCETVLATDPMHCGGCGRACTPGGTATGVGCRDYECVITECAPGTGDCNGDLADGCETNTSLDAHHCGGCGNVCLGTFGPASCVSGECAAACVPGRTADCDGRPENGCEADLHDPATCGSCTTTCDPGGPFTVGVCDTDGPSPACRVQCMDGRADCDATIANGCESSIAATNCSCSDGGIDCTTLYPAGATVTCVGRSPGSAVCEVRDCGPGASECGGACVDPTNDPFHCGACDTVCNGAEACVGGACVCASGTVCPGIGCTNTDNDRDHCGGCGRRCLTGEFCDGGTCVLDCSGGRTNCGGLCVRTASDLDHCGACDNACAAFEDCEDGVCRLECALPRVQCGSTCVDVRVDDMNCGDCGVACPASGTGFTGSSCMGGDCTPSCDAGLGDCDGSIANGCEHDVLSDAANCGACGHDCGVGGVCTSGACDPVIDLETGRFAACAVRAGGALACWGDNFNRQLGVDVDGTFPPTVVPLADVSDVAVGWAHVCAIAFDATTLREEVFCWGTDTRGQLGDGAGTRAEPFTPTRVTLPSTPIQIAAGDVHSCALLLDGTVYCWGQNNFGESGAMVGVTVVETPRLQMSDPSILEIQAGYHHTCVAHAGPPYVTCWGNGASGQLGDGTNTTPQPTPTPVSSSIGTGDHLALAVGVDHTCSVRTDGLYCWGTGSSGQIDTTTTVPALQSTPAGSGPARDGAAGSHTCVVFGAALFCRGYNHPTSPIVPGGPHPLPWTQVLAAGVHSVSRGTASGFVLARLQDGRVVGFGVNGNDQLGVDTGGGSSLPVLNRDLTP